MTIDKPKYVAKPTFEHAILTWLLYWEGWYQSEIAGHINTNAGRINEILHEKRHPGSKEAALLRKSA